MNLNVDRIHDLHNTSVSEAGDSRSVIKAEPRRLALGYWGGSPSECTADETDDPQFFLTHAELLRHSDAPVEDYQPAVSPVPVEFFLEAVGPHPLPLRERG